MAAFSRVRPWLDAAVAQIDENRALLGRLLREQLPEIGYVPGSATFLAWLDCRNLGLGDDPAAAFLDRGKVRSVRAGLRRAGRRIRAAEHRHLA